MKKTTASVLSSVSILVLGFITSVSAQPHRVFGRPERGTALPPLWIGKGPVAAPTKDQPDATTQSIAPYTPGDVRAGYGFNQFYSNGVTGSGQTIALVDAYDDTAYLQTDMNEFCSQFGLPAVTVQLVYASGSQPVTNTGWAQEASLDVQWAHAIAPGAKIMLVETADNSITSLLQGVQVAVQKGATVVSMSWGGEEFEDEPAYDSYFSAPGVTFVASAGDSGAGAQWPASSPNVVGVGGTTLVIGAGGVYESETAWSASGGGLSAYEPQPSWQKGWFPTAWESQARGTPDVAYLADPTDGVFVYYGTEWYDFGGTSVGSPQWAGLIALINSGRTSGNLAGVNKLIYTAAKKGNYTINPAYLHDIISGNDGTNADDVALPGYDLVTGLGSPVPSGLATVLGLTTSATNPPGGTPTFSVAVSPSSQVTGKGDYVYYGVTINSSGGYSGMVNLFVAGLPKGVSASFNPNSITASGSSVLTLETTTTSTPAGVYPITISGQDGSGTTQTAKATLTIGRTLVVSAITFTETQSGGENILNLVVTVQNEFHDVIPNAEVYVTLDVNGAAYASGSATTASNGKATFTMANPSNATYSAVVTQVTQAGLLWNGEYLSNSFTP